MGIVKIIAYLIAIFFIANAVVFGMYYFSENPPSEILKSIGYNPGIQKEINASGEVVQFEPNMRFNHNDISFFMNADCDDKKRTRMMEAFSQIMTETGIISFKPANENSADILIGCSKENYETEKNVFISGEGGPTEYFNLAMYPIIMKAKILLYKDSSCNEPITELHELLHVFGFDHINKAEFILYPYVECKQEINPQVISEIKRLYSIEPKAELYFTNVTAVKTGSYLNFSVQVNNEGLLDANGVSLEVDANNQKIDSFDLKNIEIGIGQKFYVTNLKLPSSTVDKIIIKIIYSGIEYKKDNNNVELSV